MSAETSLKYDTWQSIYRYIWSVRFRCQTYKFRLSYARKYHIARWQRQMSLNDMVLPGLHESETAVVSLVSMTVCMSCRLSTKVQRPSRIHSWIYIANFKKHTRCIWFWPVGSIAYKCKKTALLTATNRKPQKNHKKATLTTLTSPECQC